MEPAATYNASAMQQMVASAPGIQHPEVSYPSSPYRDSSYSRDAFLFQPIHPAFTGGIESYLDPKYASDPAAFASRLPYLPFHATYGMYDFGFEPAFIRKRNERERQRVKCVNEGYARLREHLPQEYAEKRLSKVETLRGAIQYIKHLQSVLGVDKEKIKGKSDRSNDKQSSKASNSLKDSENENEFSTDEGKAEDEEAESPTSSIRSPTPSDAREDSSLHSTPQPTIKVEAPSPRSIEIAGPLPFKRSNRNTLCGYSATNNQYRNPSCYEQKQHRGTWKGYPSSCSYAPRSASCSRTNFPDESARVDRFGGRNQHQEFTSDSYGFAASKNYCNDFRGLKSTFSNYDYGVYSPSQCSGNLRYFGHAQGSDMPSQYESMANNSRDYLSSAHYYRQAHKTKSPTPSLHTQVNNGGFGSFQHLNSTRGRPLIGRVEGDSDGFKSDNSPSSSSIGTSP